jgi:hypothetical protein
LIQSIQVMKSNHHTELSSIPAKLSEQFTANIGAWLKRDRNHKSIEINSRCAVGAHAQHEQFLAADSRCICRFSMFITSDCHRTRKRGHLNYKHWY